MDEFISVLIFNEVEFFFKIINDFKKKNIGIIYIIYCFEEVFKIVINVVIMRDGIIIFSGLVKDFICDMFV